MTDIYKQLKRPFHERSISWRVGATNKDKTKAIALAYIDARDVMQRLDDVFGMNWQVRYSHAETKTICELSVQIEGNWITRANGAGDSDIEAEKGAISDAFKRAAVMFGIGRYLYELPNEWVAIDEYKKILKPPQLPHWATPQGFDSGFTPNGMIFGEARQRYLEDITLEVTKVYARTAQGENDAFAKWTSFLPEFKVQEEQMYSWFGLESNVRSAIKRIQSQVKSIEKETK
jgi:hypothetical protein